MAKRALYATGVGTAWVQMKDAATDTNYSVPTSPARFGVVFGGSICNRKPTTGEAITFSLRAVNAAGTITPYVFDALEVNPNSTEGIGELKAPLPPGWKLECKTSLATGADVFLSLTEMDP